MDEKRLPPIRTADDRIKSLEYSIGKYEKNEVDEIGEVDRLHSIKRLKIILEQERNSLYRELYKKNI